ncbi:MAG: TIGR04086 family membrane protein [Clostridia bacterium]|nr:TIGR04086 family membrane protein [Clostridia bacterium]
MEGDSFIPRRERGLDSFTRSVRRGMRRGKGKGALGAVLRGVLLGAAITVGAVAAFALILNWWDASDRAITAINQVIKFVAILAAVASAMDGGTEGGAMRGACTGLLYMALGIVCYSLMMGQSPRLTAHLADLGMGIAAGGLFGMILLSGKKAA